MWPSNRLQALLNVEHPIIQAPMIVQKPLFPLAAAVSNAGGMGSLGCAEMSTTELHLNVSRLRAETVRPFNLNFFLHQEPEYDPLLDSQLRQRIAPVYNELGLRLPEGTNNVPLSTFSEEQLAVLEELRPPVVSFHFGSPSRHVVETLKACDTTILATATTVREACVLESAGVDAIVAQGWEAGGHRGSFDVNFEDVGIGTMALVPQIIDAVNIPVIAAGGIGDGRGIAAAFALGASGVQMGTAFLSCIETPITQQHRQALLAIEEDDTSLSRAFSGRPCRARRNSYSDMMAAERPQLQDFPLMYNYSGAIKRHGIENEILNYQFLLYGQAAGLNKEMPAQQLIASLVDEAASVFGRNRTIQQTRS